MNGDRGINKKTCEARFLAGLFANVTALAENIFLTNDDSILTKHESIAAAKRAIDRHLGPAPGEYDAVLGGKGEGPRHKGAVLGGKGEGPRHKGAVLGGK